MDYEGMIQEATDKLRRRMSELSQVREKIQESRTKVRSADGMITVVVDGQGELSSITFNTTKWRRMPPTELAAVLVQTINRARAESRDELLRAYGKFLPKGFGRSGSQDGPPTTDQLFDDVMRRASEMLGEELPLPGATRSAGSANNQKGQAHD